MKIYIALSFLILGASLQAADVTCNERARHGKRGASKLVLTTLGGIGLYHMLGEFWDSSEPLRTGNLQLKTYNKDQAKRRTCYAALVVAALGYLTYNLASESYSSLGIFLDDDEEEELALESPSDETAL